MKRDSSWLGWILLTGPAVAQIVLLAIAIVGRFRYPYDLEWMEGGLLHHAQRIGSGAGIYAPPSIDFVPYLYTPLYPGLLAVLGAIFGLSYQLGRMISILSLIGIGVIGARIVIGSARGGGPRARNAAIAGAVYAFGLFAASYDWCDGWYDLVRADTLFLLMITLGLALAIATVRTGTGLAGHGRTAAAAAILALSFFCKQTGIMYVAVGGVIVLAGNWRRIFVYVATAGLIGLGGTAILDRATGGWFWTYIYKIHQAHDWNVDRYWMAFRMLGEHLPVVTWLIAVTALVSLFTYAMRGKLPRAGQMFLIWTFIYMCSAQVAGITFGTEFAVRNDFMPALLHGAIAAALAIPALAGCVATLMDGQRRADVAPTLVGVGATLALAAQCVFAWWHPLKFVPSNEDRAAGDRLIARLRAVDGDVWVPSHPWYAHLAGKRMFVHRMGIKDVTWRQKREVRGLDEAIAQHRFAAIVLDSSDLVDGNGLEAVPGSYQQDVTIPLDERPRTFTGAHTVPTGLWVPIGPPVMPAGTTVLFDFEDPASWSTWTVEGEAWKGGPVAGPMPNQGPVRRAGGHRWITSLHGGEDATGVATSPVFTIAGSKLALRLGGGTDDGLRVELVVDGKVERTVRLEVPSEVFVDKVVDVADLDGKRAQLRLVDQATGAWAHLNVDEVWLEP